MREWEWIEMNGQHKRETLNGEMASMNSVNTLITIIIEHRIVSFSEFLYSFPFMKLSLMT